MDDAAFPPDLRVDDGIAVLRPTGRMTHGEMVAAVDAGIEAACDAGIPCLLIDLRDLVGFPTPSLADRAGMVRRWAATANGRLRAAAMVAPVALIDEHRFGVVAAAGYGLVGQVFDDDADAFAWLRDH